MTGHRNGPVGSALPLELRWDHQRPLPARWVLPEGRQHRVPTVADRSQPFDFSAQMARLCADVAGRCETLQHVHMPRVLVTFTPSRNRSRYGLQARVTPLRFRNGALTRRHGAIEYQVQRFFVDGREMLYLLTFCLPRFLDQSFDEKMVTVFHELFHVSPSFDGDLRRHPGRYAVHTHSKAHYDSHVAVLARQYVEDHPEPSLFTFLRAGYRELWDRHGGIVGTVVPRPKLLPIGWTPARAAARSQENKSG
jgi:predicted metallopeptidase